MVMVIWQVFEILRIKIVPSDAPFFVALGNDLLRGLNDIKKSLFFWGFKISSLDLTFWYVHY